MSEKALKKKELAYRIAGSILLCIAVFFSALVIGKVGMEGVNYKSVGEPFGMAAIALSLFEILCFFYSRKKEGNISFFRIGCAVLDIAAAVCSFLVDLSLNYWFIAAIIYLIMPILKRVASIVKKPKKRNIVINALMLLVNLLLLVIAVACYLFEEAEFREILVTGIVGTIMLVMSVFNIGIVALSNLKVELLRKIIRKTYAGEILFGMLLLVVSFSLALTSLEENVKTFWDALWYCFAVVTTIGFGDIVATTIFGRILTVILGLYGLVVVAIITSIIVNFYTEVKSTPDDEDEEDTPTQPTQDAGEKDDPEKQ